MRHLILCSISWYQRKGSLFLSFLFPGAHQCRFSPSCSHYTYEAVSRYGTIKGLFLGCRRIMRCHPYSRSPYLDPVL